MKIKISKKYPLTDGKFVVGFFKFAVAKETKQYYIIDNVTVSDIELLHLEGIDFLIIKRNKTYTYDDTEWLE